MAVVVVASRRICIVCRLRCIILSNLIFIPKLFMETKRWKDENIKNKQLNRKQMWSMHWNVSLKSTGNCCDAHCSCCIRRRSCVFEMNVNVIITKRKLFCRRCSVDYRGTATHNASTNTCASRAHLCVLKPTHTHTRDGYLNVRASYSPTANVIDRGSVSRTVHTCLHIKIIHTPIYRRMRLRSHTLIQTHAHTIGEVSWTTGLYTLSIQLYFHVQRNM